MDLSLLVAWPGSAWSRASDSDLGGPRFRPRWISGGQLLLLCASSVAAVTPSGAQPVIEIGDSVSCSECRIQLDPIVTLPRMGTSFDRFPPVHVSSDQRGRLYLIPSGARELWVYDGELGRSWRVGNQGFDRLTRPLLVVDWKADSLGVLDGARRSLFILTPDDRVSRRLRFPHTPSDWIWLKGDSIVVAYPGRDAATIGFPLHLWRVPETDEEPMHLRSFGSLDGKTLHPADMVRRISLDSDGRIWSAYRQEYRIELWEPDGTLLLTLLRSPGWFNGPQPNAVGGPQTAPASFLRDLRFGGGERLWSASMVPSSDWVEAWLDADSKPDYERLFDGMLEVIDPITSSVMTRTRIPQVPVAFISEDRIVLWGAADAETSPELTIVRAVVQPTSGGA